MRRLAYLIAIILTVLCSRQRLCAQNAYDAALDKYEKICNQCIDLRNFAARGVQISEEKLASMLSQLKELKETLSAAEGQMTDEQKARFQKIRKRYINAMKGREPLDIEGFNDSLGRGAESLGTGLDLSQRERLAYVPTAHSWTLYGDFGVYPVLSYGARVNYWNYKLKYFSTYFKVRGNFVDSATDYECKSDGTTNYGYIWTASKERKSRFVATGGLEYRIAKTSISAYIGVGYGRYTLAWEDTNGAFAKVSDCSVSGVCADFGVVVDVMRNMHLLVGVNTHFKTYSELELGVGYTF